MGAAETRAVGLRKVGGELRECEVWVAVERAKEF